MKKSLRKKNKKQKTKQTTKTKKFLGGETRIIKIKGYYDKDPENFDKLIDYVIVTGKMNDNDKLNYLNKHKIYPNQEKSLLDNFINSINVDSTKVEKIAEHFFKHNSNDDIDVDDKTVIIHDIEDNKKLKVAKQIIENINKSKTITLPSGPFRNNYEYYKNIINLNITIFLTGVDTTNDVGKDILLSPKIYKYIIEKYSEKKINITDLKLVNSELQKLKPI